MQKERSRQIQFNLQSDEEIYQTAIPADHPYRKIIELVNWKPIIKPLRKLYSSKGEIGIDVETGLKALLIQFWEDYSDRQMEKALRENLAVKWFCNLSLGQDTPDHSYFGKLRKRLGTERIERIFREVTDQLTDEGFGGSFFSVIDASTIISKTQLWKERDEAIADGEEKLNNKVVNKYTVDKDAKWGAKSKNNIWFGYKNHASIDCKIGMIEDVCVTPANVPDYQAVKYIAPKNKGVYTDKGYDYEEVTDELSKKGSTHLGIQKNNRKTKDKGRDAYRTRIRMPFESTFATLQKRARYKGIEKVKFQVFMQSMVFNIKKAIKYESVILHG